ncbi:MAG: hypothetical protein AAB584_02450 [Patescibacteria group bacterium]
MAAKNVSAVVSGAGFAAAFWVALDKACRQRGVEDEGIYNALKDGSPLVERFADFISESALRVFAIWKTIKLGLHKSPEAYENTFEAASFRISDYARKILKKISVSQTEVELDLVKVTPAGLDLKNPTYQRICDRAIELGLEKCPREVGPALRLAYQNQPYREWLWVAMEPEAGSDGVLRVFGVVRDDDELWLHALWFSPRSTWRGDDRFVFVRPRK